MSASERAIRSAIETEEPGVAVAELPETLAEGRLRAGVAAAGALRWAAVDITEIVEAARLRLDLSPVASAALGRSLAAATLLLRLAVKTPARLMLEVAGDGPLGRVLAEADDRGNLRGMVGNRLADVPHTAEGKLDVGRAVGKGRLRVAREREGKSYQSQVELVSGEIGEDVAHFLEQSEQTRSAVLLGVLGRPGGVAAAGGIFVEALPGTADAIASRLEANVLAAGGVSRLVEGGGSSAVREAVLAGLDPVEHEVRGLVYRCRCSRERLAHHLTPLPDDDLTGLTDDDGLIRAECAFCGESYRFRREDLRPPEGGAG